MKKIMKFDVKSIIFLCLLAVTLILTIVGICIPWISEKVGTEVINTATINDYFTNGLTEVKGFWTMFSLALVVVLSNAVIVIAYILSIFFKSEKLTALWCICILVSLVLLLCSAFTLYFTKVHIKAVFISDVGNYKCVLGAGAWILSLFGIVGGITGLFAFCPLANESREVK